MFLAPVCLVTQPPKRGSGEKSGYIHMQVDTGPGLSGRLWAQKYLGMGVSTGKNQSWGSLDHPGLRAEKRDGSRHHPIPNPCKENK